MANIDFDSDLVFLLLILAPYGLRIGNSLYRQFTGKEYDGIVPNPEPYKPLLGHFEGKVDGGGWKKHYRFVGRYRGFDFKILVGRIMRQGEILQLKANPFSINISLALPHPIRYRLLLGHTHRLAIYPHRRVRSANPEFDANVRAYSNGPTKAALFLNNGQCRQAIRELIDKGWTETWMSEIVVGEKEISVTRFYKPTFSQPGFISDTLDKLIILANGVE